MAKKAFQEIRITSQAELDAIIERYNDVGWGSIEEADLRKAVRFVQAPTIEDQLERWVRENSVDLCSTGRDKILKAAKKGKITSWADYFRKHWNDDDGVQGWLESNSDGLVGQSVELIPDDEYDDDGDLVAGGEAFATYDEFAEANDLGDNAFVAWPFTTAKKVTKKAKKSTRKSRR